MVSRNMFIKLISDTDDMSPERSDERIAAIEAMVPTAFIECADRHRARPREGA